MIIVIIVRIIFNSLIELGCLPPENLVCTDYSHLMIVKPLDCGFRCFSLSYAITSNILHLLLPFISAYILMSLLEKK